MSLLLADFIYSRDCKLNLRKTVDTTDSHERKLLIHSLVELKNQFIQQGRYTDCVDELIFKVINAPTKRMKIEYV